jgi:hypothetical protein
MLWQALVENVPLKARISRKVGETDIETYREKADGRSGRFIFP